MNKLELFEKEEELTIKIVDKGMLFKKKNKTEDVYIVTLNNSEYLLHNISTGQRWNDEDLKGKTILSIEENEGMKYLGDCEIKIIQL